MSEIYQCCFTSRLKWYMSKITRYLVIFAIIAERTKVQFFMRSAIMYVMSRQTMRELHCSNTFIISK